MEVITYRAMVPSTFCHFLLQPEKQIRVQLRKGMIPNYGKQWGMVLYISPF